MESRMVNASNSPSGATRRLVGVGAVLLSAVALTAALLWGVRSGGFIFQKLNVASLPLEVAPAPLPSIAEPRPEAFSEMQGTVDAIAKASAPEAPAMQDAAHASGATQEIVAVVAGEAITLRDFQEAVAIDALMAAWAGVQSASAGAILEQLINTATVLHRGEVKAEGAQASLALDQFLQTHHRTRAELKAALEAQGIAWERFERYFVRLIAADEYLRTQQAATDATSAELLQIWRQETPISFGPAADGLFDAASAPGAQNQTDEVEASTVPSAVDSVAEIVAEPRGVEVGQLAPAFRLPAMPDFTVKTLQDFSGRPTVLSFWTTWCPYCLRQTPVMVEAHHRWQALGVEFVGINVRETSDLVEKYMAQHEIAYPILLDADGAVAADYAIQGFPTTYFLNANHRIVARHVGALTSERLETYLQTLQPQ